MTSFPKSGFTNWFPSLSSTTFPRKEEKNFKHDFYLGVQKMKSNVKDTQVTDGHAAGSVFFPKHTLTASTRPHPQPPAARPVIAPGAQDIQLLSYLQGFFSDSYAQRSWGLPLLAISWPQSRGHEHYDHRKLHFVKPAAAENQQRVPLYLVQRENCLASVS